MALTRSGSPPAIRPRRLVPVTTGVLVALAAGVVLSLFVGSNHIPAAEVWAALSGRADSPEATVVLTQRLPRTVLAFAVGLGLAAGGLAFRSGDVGGDDLVVVDNPCACA